eukprot:scaffold16412_cov59-Phaeocystis_antarctica.AAC.8
MTNYPPRRLLPALGLLPTPGFAAAAAAVSAAVASATVASAAASASATAAAAWVFSAAPRLYGANARLRAGVMAITTGSRTYSSISFSSSAIKPLIKAGDQPLMSMLVCVSSISSTVRYFSKAMPSTPAMVMPP